MNIVERPLSGLGRKHLFVNKDYHRVFNQHIIINTDKKKKARQKSATSLKKYKSRSQLLIDEYKNPEVSNDKLYVIEKAVRYRALQGRYGVDHSEILNYEYEQANKDRSDHMNTLVYKSATPRKNNNEKENRHYGISRS